MTNSIGVSSRRGRTRLRVLTVVLATVAALMTTSGSAPRLQARATAAAQSRLTGTALPLSYSTGNATRVITIASASSRAMVAELQAWQRAPGGGWLRHGLPITAHVGAGGIGATREWRQVTPAGSFTLTQAFGYYSNPGTRLPYFRAGDADWWISQYGPLYNTHQRCLRGCPFRLGGPNTHLARVRPYYDFGVVIDYNTRNSPAGVRQGFGSAFFLHVTDGRPTAGCVAIPKNALVSLMRWLSPAAHPRILIGLGPASRNPSLRVTVVSSTGSTVQVRGYATDPDANPVEVRLYEGSGYRVTTTDPRSHAFGFGFLAGNGRHVYRVVAVNAGRGTGSVGAYRGVTVDGSPFGYLDSATVNADSSVTLKGWAVDRDGSGTSINVAVQDGSTLLGTFAADTSRADVDAVLRVSGNHGFTITLPAQSPGEHSYAVYAVNYGYPAPDGPLVHSPQLVTVP